MLFVEFIPTWFIYLLDISIAVDEYHLTDYISHCGDTVRLPLQPDM